VRPGGLAVAALLAAGCRASPVPPLPDLLLTNGRVLDGTGAPWVRQDVAIAGDRIVFAGHAGDAGVAARDTVDVAGLLVVPGFWDVHNHADLDQPHGRTALPLLYQGITTVVQGVDGGGRNSVAEIFAGYEREGVAVNVIRFVGHNAARSDAMGGDFGREATAAEIDRMRAYVARGMEEGAVGFSTGLAYNPGYYASTAEVTDLARVAARYGGVYDTHDRDMGATLNGFGFLNSVREAIAIAEAAGTPLIFSHFSALGAVANAQMPEAIALVEAARARGVNVMGGQHPYTASQGTITGHVLPRWVAIGGEDSLRRRLRDPARAGEFDRDVMAILTLRGGPDKIVLVSEHAAINGRSLAQLAAAWRVPVPEVVRRIVEEFGPRTFDINLDIFDLRNIRALAQKDWMMTCLDGFTPAAPRGVDHPRSYGAVTRKLRVLALEEGTITLPFAVRGMTSLAAQFYGIPDRGLIKRGFHADIAVLDESRIRDRATFEDPYRYSEGTVHVLVNGRFALRDGRPTGDLAGRPVRRGGRAPAPPERP
jgi:N-acyl-D-amino-acid deacylase